MLLWIILAAIGILFSLEFADSVATAGETGNSKEDGEDEELTGDYDYDDETDMEEDESSSEKESEGQGEDADAEKAGDDASAEQKSDEEKSDAHDKEEEKGQKGAEDHGFTDELLTRAAKLGFSKDDVISLGNAANLELAVRNAERIATTLGHKTGQDSSSAKADEQEGASDDGKYKLELDEDFQDPDIVKAVRGMNDHYAERTAKLEAVLSQVVTKLQTQTKKQIEDRFEQKISSLDDEWKEVFGKGRFNKLDPKSEQAKNRIRLFQEQIKIASTHPDLPEDEVFQRALRSEFGSEIETRARKKVSNQLRDRKGKFTARPTDRKGRDLSDGNPDKDATDFVKGFYRDRGIAVGDDEIDEVDGV